MTQENSWPEILGKLLAKQALTRGEADWAMTQIMAGDASDAQVGAFMLAMRSKGETVDELAGLVDVMLRNAVILNTGSDAVDVVGTGGDMVGTVNISSMASILAAGAGIPVMKHGSRSASGKTGSSEMLEVLGIRLDLSPERVADVFREVGITFFFAPVFHPAMRYVAPIRRELGIPTTFNFLGPLANPAQPIATSLGVANGSVAPLMAQEVAQRGRTALVFRGRDGLDELSITGPSDVWQVVGGEVHHYELDPSRLGIPVAKLDQLLGGDPQHNAQVAKALFEGTLQGPIVDVVKLNAASAVVAYELAKMPANASVELESRFSDALQRVTLALESGSAGNKLSDWMTATQA
jgi:anthranilate phosphoribosyltransferase